VATAQVLQESTDVGRESGWDSEQIYCDGDEYFSAVLSSIESARESVFVESYIFDSDTLGKRLVDALQAARGRGVEVRVLIDGVGSANFISRSLSAVRRSGLEIRVHHPLPWQIVPNFLFAKGLGLRAFLRVFSLANSRNHRKLIVIDGQMAFVGSLNVSEVHLAEVLNSHSWHDVGVRLQGELCSLLNLIFQKTWNKSWRSTASGFLKPQLPLRLRLPIPESPFIIRNDGRKLRHQALSERLQMIRGARRRVWIANAYFVPGGQLLRSLMAAARRGVDVRILLPQISDVHFMPWVSRAFYESLIRHGVRVYEYTPRVLHAKVMLTDETAWIGSSNLNHRSLLHDLELDVVLNSDASLRRLEEIFTADFNSSHEIDKLSGAGQPFLQRMAVGLLLYFRHLL
jgi:cardiolipin synthase